MANRNPSTALIRGEATARRNFDNAPGMYSGINKVIKAGSNLMKEAGDQGMKKRVEKENSLKPRKKPTKKSNIKRAQKVERKRF